MDRLGFDGDAGTNFDVDGKLADIEIFEAKVPGFTPATCRRTVFFLMAGTDEPPAAKKSKSFASSLLLFEGDDKLLDGPAIVVSVLVELGGRVTIAFKGVVDFAPEDEATTEGLRSG